MTLSEKAAKGLAASMAGPGLIAAGFVLLGFLPENGFWGLNHLFFYSQAWRIVIALLAVAAFLPSSTRLYLATASRLADLPPAVKRAALVLTPLALFILFRVAVHSLGDGYQRAFEIEKGRMYSPTEMLDYLIHAIAYRLFDLLGNPQATTAMAFTSIIIGVVFVLTTARLTPFSGEKRWGFLLLIFSLGSSQLFFGYVESYTLLYFATVWYLLLLFQPPGREPSFKRITSAYLLAGLAHQAGIILLPSYLLVAHQRYANHRRRFMIFPAILLAALLPMALPAGINQLLAIESTRKFADYFLPLSGTPYSLLSPLHFFDIFNQFLLVAPIVLMSIPSWPFMVSRKDGRLLAASLMGPALLFIFLLDPALTMARDWDLFAVPVIIAVFPLLLRFVNTFPDNPASLRRLITAGLVAAVLSGTWIGLNHSADKHLCRAEYILDHSVKGKRYGYELLAYYFSSRGDFSAELRMLQKIPRADWTARIYAKISQSLYSQGHYEEAYDLAQKGVLQPNPNELNALMAGVTAYDRNEYPKAIHYLRIAANYWPDDPQVFCKLADALRDGDSLATAAETYEKVVSMNSQLARPYFGLALVYCRLKNYDQADQYYREGLRRDPSYSTAPLIESMLKNRQ